MKSFLKNFYNFYDSFAKEYGNWLSNNRLNTDDDDNLEVNLQYNGWKGGYPLIFTCNPESKENPFRVHFVWSGNISFSTTKNESFKKFDDAVKYFLKCFETMHNNAIGEEYKLEYEGGEIKAERADLLSSLSRSTDALNY